MTLRHVLRRGSAPAALRARLLCGAGALLLVTGCGSVSAPPAATTGPSPTSDGGTMTTGPDGPAGTDGPEARQDTTLGAGSVLTAADDGAVVQP